MNGREAERRAGAYDQGDHGRALIAPDGQHERGQDGEGTQQSRTGRYARGARVLAHGVIGDVETEQNGQDHVGGKQSAHLRSLRTRCPDGRVPG